MPWHWGYEGVIDRGHRQRADRAGRRPERFHPRRQGLRVQRRKGMTMAEPMGFFTDTTVCIGCKACEVACKQWNQLPAAQGGQNTLSRRQLRQHAQARRHALAPRAVHRAVQRGPQGRALAHDERRLQALRAGGLPGGVPDQRDHPHRVRHRGHPVGRLQRLQGLHRGLPVRRDRHQPGVEHRAEVHPLLRPAAGRHGAGVLPGLPDRLDPVRPGEGAAQPGGRARGAAARSRARSAPTCTAPTKRCSAG